MKKKIYLLAVLLLAFISSQMQGQSYPTGTVGYTVTPMTIDGNIDDWEGIVRYTNNNRVIDTSSVTDTDVSWSVAWDSTHFYVMADVTDDVVIESPNAPGKGGDRVKVSWGTANMRDGQGWGTAWPDSKGGSEFWYTEDGSDWTGGELGTWVEGVAYSMVAKEGGYIFEAVLPLQAEFSWFEYVYDEAGEIIDTVLFVPETGKKILFELGICDYDGGGEGEYVELNWGNSLNTWGSMDDAGALVFTHPLPAGIINYTETAKTIDGNIDDWDGMVRYHNTNRVIDTSSVTDTDGYWSAAWDSTHLYFMADVTDIAVVESPNAPGKGGDRIKVSWGTANMRDGQGWGAVWPDSKGGSEFWYTEDGSDWTGGELGTWVDGVAYAMVPKEGGYIFEAVLPLQAEFSIFGYEYDEYGAITDTILFVPGAGKTILFEMGICDYDGGGEGEYVELNWGLSPNTWATMDYAGALNFINASLDFTELQAAIESAEADVAAATIGEGIGEYLQSVVDAANAAIAAAEASMAALDTQDKIDGSLADLQIAMSLFVANVDTTSVQKIQTVNFRLYPNPANDLLTVHNVSGVKTISIYSVTGKLINSYVNSNSVIRLNVSDLPSGLYLMKFDTDQGVSAKRFIKK